MDRETKIHRCPNAPDVYVDKWTPEGIAQATREMEARKDFIEHHPVPTPSTSKQK